MLTFANDSTDNHFVVMARLQRGTTIAAFKDWVDSVTGGGPVGPPTIRERLGLDTGAVSPGHRMQQTYLRPRGQHVLTCFWPDADMGGTPHAFMGMYRAITLR